MKVNDAFNLYKAEGLKEIQRIKDQKLSMILDEIKGYAKSGKLDHEYEINDSDKKHIAYFEDELKKLGYRVNYSFSKLYINWNVENWDKL